MRATNFRSYHCWSSFKGAIVAYDIKSLMRDLEIRGCDGLKRVDSPEEYMCIWSIQRNESETLSRRMNVDQSCIPSIDGILRYGKGFRYTNVNTTMKKVTILPSRERSWWRKFLRSPADYGAATQRLMLFATLTLNEINQGFARLWCRASSRWFARSFMSLGSSHKNPMGAVEGVKQSDSLQQGGPEMLYQGCL